MEEKKELISDLIEEALFEMSSEECPYCKTGNGIPDTTKCQEYNGRYLHTPVICDVCDKDFVLVFQIIKSIKEMPTECVCEQCLEDQEKEFIDLDKEVAKAGQHIKKLKEQKE